jgi:hypothetical protein
VACCTVKAARPVSFVNDGCSIPQGRHVVLVLIDYLSSPAKSITPTIKRLLVIKRCICYLI